MEKRAALLFVALLFCSQSAFADIDAPSDKYDFPSSRFLVQHDFAMLEKRFGELNALYKTGKISDEELHVAYEKLGTNADDGQENLFDEWIKRYPKSSVALTARGYYYVQKGWRIRGKDYSRKTTSEQLDGFSTYLTKAHADFLQSAALDAKPIASYFGLLMVAGGLGSDDLEMVYRRALKTDPASVRARLLYLNYLQPRWGGSVAAMATAAEEAERSTMSRENKQRVKGLFYANMARAAESADDARDALKLYWSAYKEAPEYQLSSLKTGALLAQKVRDFDQAVRFLETMVSEHWNDLWAHRQIGHINETQYKQLDKAFAEYTLAADRGDYWSQGRLGWWYINGIHVRRNMDMAEKYWKLAAAQGDKESMRNLEKLAQERKQGAN